MKKLRSYVWTGLDLKSFAVVAIWPQDQKNAAILMRKRGAPQEEYPWCVEWRGAGRYFQTINAALEYCDSRGFRQEVPM